MSYRGKCYGEYGTFIGRVAYKTALATMSPLLLLYGGAMARVATIACNVVLMPKQRVVLDIVGRHFAWLSSRTIRPYASRHAHPWGLSLTVVRPKENIVFVCGQWIASRSFVAHEKQSVKRDDSRIEALVKCRFQPRAGPLWSS